MSAPDNAALFIPLTPDALEAMPQAVPVATSAPADEAERIAKACKMVKECSPIAGTPAAVYLAGRAIPPDTLPRGVVGWHQPSGAILFVARDEGGDIQAVQRVFLKPDGTAKPDPKKPEKKWKLTNGLIKGAAMSLPGDGGEVPISDGPEDALSLWLATGLAVRCPFGVSGLKSVPLPAGAVAVLVADNDAPDATTHAAITKAAAHLIERGFQVKVARPPEGVKDANDLLRERGAEAVKEMIEAAEPVAMPGVEANSEALTQAAEITRLAALSPIDYDREREAAAKRLGCKVSALDAEIQQTRKQAAGKDKAGGAVAAADARGRSDLEVNSADLPDTAVELAGFLARQPMIFDRGGPAKLAFDEQKGGLVAGLLNVNSVVNECHQIARPFVWEPGDAGPKKKYITIPERVAKLYLALKGQWGLRPLDGIAQAPLLNEGGDMRAVDGYDPASRLWCEKVPAVEVPPRPSRKDAEAALLLLRTALRTFTFADAEMVDDPALRVKVVDLTSSAKQDETAALAAILTAVCRPSLWLAPGVAVRAPPYSGAGTGKGLLCRGICAIAYGQRPQALTAGGTPEEFDKRVTAALIGAEAVLFLDNINGTTLKSDILASILTERPCYVRPLGRSATVPLNASTLVLVTGNGLMLSEDLARRFLVVELDAGMEDPEARDFPGDLLADLMTRRSDLLQAALIIWRWGQQNPAELERGKPLGSFEQWCKWVRDPLLTLGCADPAEKVAATKSNDPRRRAIAELFNAWWEAHSNNPVAIAELTDRVRMVADPQNKGRQYLAAYIRRLEGTRAAGFVLTRNDAAGKWTPDRYQLFQADKTSESESIGDHRGHRDEIAPVPLCPPMTPYAFEVAPSGQPEIKTGMHEVEL